MRNTAKLINVIIMALLLFASCKKEKLEWQDVEKLVLAQAVWNHLNNRVLVYNNKTVVFT